MRIEYSHFPPLPDRYLRIGPWQVGYHPRGRYRLLSERTQGKKLCPTVRVGRIAEISWGRLRKI